MKSNHSQRTSGNEPAVIVEFLRGTSTVESVRMIKKLYRPSKRFTVGQEHRHRRRDFVFNISEQSLVLELLDDYETSAPDETCVRVIFAPSVIFDTDARTLADAISQGSDALKELAGGKFNETVALFHSVEVACSSHTPIEETAEYIKESYIKAGIPVGATSAYRSRQHRG